MKTNGGRGGKSGGPGGGKVAEWSKIFHSDMIYYEGADQSFILLFLVQVFPAKGLLFFSDWGSTPHISRMNMDGTDLRVIINESISWPNALTIDYVTEKIFWGDADLDYIAMADLNGENSQIIIGDKNHVSHVFALATFESEF